MLYYIGCRIPRGADCDDGHILGSILDDLRIIRLGHEEKAGTKDAQNGEDHAAGQGQKDTVSGDGIGSFKFFLTETAGKQGIDTDTGTGSNGDHQVLDREGQRYGSQCRFVHLGHKNAVNNVVKCLYQHGNDHG